MATADLDRLGIPLPEAELQARFEALQRRLIPQWERIEAFTDEPYAMVVVPSLSGVDLPLDSTKRQAYEERYLFLLFFLLRQPRARVIYVTSEAVQPNLIDYYVGLLPGVVASHARARLYLVSPHDGGPAPLSAKLLERPRLLDEIRSLAGDPDCAHVVPFSTTRLERISPFGSGSRCTAPIRSSPRWERRAAGVRCSPRLVSLIQRAERACAPATTSSTRCSSCGGAAGHRVLVLKHDEGVSGYGNAVLDARGLNGAGRARVEQRLSELRPEDAHLSAERFLERLARGGIVEELIVARERSQPERADARDTPREGRAAVDARPAAGWGQRADLHRLRVSGK